MNLKKLLKNIKLNESTISMILGAIVIVIVGVMAIRFFGSENGGKTIPPINVEGEITLPTTHTVKEGEDLWKISEIYYDNGYNWIDIAQANDITNPNQIETGQKLHIPKVSAKVDQATSTPTPIVETAETATPTLKQEVEQVAELPEADQQPIQGATYTVSGGDTLWNISLRAYGDGYRWVDIAKANDLQNPDLIHRGNVFVIPR